MCRMLQALADWLAPLLCQNYDEWKVLLAYFTVELRVETTEGGGTFWCCVKTVHVTLLFCKYLLFSFIVVVTIHFI